MVYSNSRFIHTRVDMFNYPRFIMGIRQPAIFNKQNCILYRFAVGDNLRVIAHKYYGAPELWWAILDANPTYDSELEINIGDVILIPNYREVLNYV